MKKIFHSTGHLFILFCILLSPVFSQDFVDATPVQQVERPTIVEANHYFSNKDRSVNYNVVSVNKSLPIVIIPKNEQSQRMSFSNRVNVTLNDNQGNYISCLFQDNFELCVLEKFTADSLSMIIQCDSVPCEFSWIMIQTPIQKINTNNVQKTSVKQLYEVQQSQKNRHLIIKVSCDSPELEPEFHNHLEFYANKDNYHKVKTEGLTYLLFSNPPTSFKEYFFVRIGQKFRQCARIQIFNQQPDVEINTLVNDFVFAGSSVVYNLDIPKKDMRIDANVHFFANSTQFTGDLNVKVMGTVGGMAQTIRKMTLSAKKKKNLQFSFVLNNITSDFTNVQILIESNQIDALIKFQILSGEIQRVQKGQFSFFSLKKGEKVNYQIVQDSQASKGDQIYIFPSDQTKIILSTKSCDSQAGCQFSLEVTEDYDGSIYLGQSKAKNTEQVVKFTIQDSFSKRVHEDTIIYLKKTVEQKKYYQFVVNTHNVLMYAADENKCPQPSQLCHQKAGNSHNPFIYEADKNATLIISIHALDETEFKLTVIEENGEYPQLADGVPFAYLMDDKEEDVVLKFSLDQKQDVTFNLVAPLNQLALYVFQDNKLPKDYVKKAETFSVEGYVNLKKSQLKSKQFILVVRKIDPGKARYVHFTLIASTKNANIKLEAGITHHEKLTPNEFQDFVLQFDPEKNYVVSFYIHNSVGQKINLSLDLSKNDTYIKDQPNGFTIDREVDQIDISAEGKKVCQSKETHSCEVFLRLRNKMQKQIDLQLTLLTANSIVELHDGIWQYFPEELTSTTTHFYFFPKHSSNPVSIMYKSNNPDLRIMYSLIKMDADTINPELWSFPKPTNQKQNSNLNWRQVKHIQIGKQALSYCQPNCLVLMTLAKAQVVKGQFAQIQRNKQFGILVSNNIIDVPQKTKIDVTLQKGQMKYMKMSMKNVFQHDTMTCYIYTTLGFSAIYANACSQKNLRMPSPQEFDLSFGILETQLRAQTIQNKFKDRDIDQTQNPYLCLVAVSDENSKFSIEYTSEQETISLLRLDEFRTVTLEPGKPKYFQIQASIQNTVKIVRNKGFPNVEEKKCTGKDVTYEQCLEDLQQSTEGQKYQIIEKVKKYEYVPCQKCIVYIKLSAQESAQVDIHLESKYTESTLQEKKMLTDYLEKNEQNRYEVTALTNQPTFINVNVIEGNVKCTVTDLSSISIQKQSDNKQRVLHFYISPSQLAQAKNNLNNVNSKSFQQTFQSLFSGFGLQMIFTTLHISIESTQPQKGASYTIQYSSGERQSYIQDGLVNNYRLEGNNPKNPVKFYYVNQDELSHVYMFLGAKKSSELSKLDIKIYQMEDQTDQENKKQISATIPQIRKKTIKPTVLYLLPIAKFYSVEVINPTGTEIDISVGVNHQEVLFLPYDIEYPFPLINGQSVDFIIDVQNKGYILLTMKKCDESIAQISYTFDYEGFKQGEYQYTTTLTNQPKFQELIKVKQPGPLYINIKRNEPQGISLEAELISSVFSLNSKFSFDKMKTTDFIKPGNKGLISYELLSNDKIKLEFSEVTCESKSEFCGDKFEYFLVASNKLVDVYSQTVCPSTYFADTENKERHQVLPLRKILQKPDSRKRISFEYQFEKSNPISYVAIKAVYKNKQDQSIEVYYQVVEVATLWGQVQKASGRFKYHLAIGLGILAFCVFIICLRRQKRKGYQSLQQSD